MNPKDISNLSEGAAWEALLEIMATLRGEQGCPWDKKQTHESLKACLLEETYEVLDAIDGKSPESLKEELGDLLLQVVFHGQIAREAQTFQIKEVLTHLMDKLIRRHPHVFSDEVVENPEEAIGRWEKIKAKERGAHKSVLSGLPPELPALLRAYRMGSKAARVGFDWPDAQGVLDKVTEEVTELKEALQEQNAEKIDEEFGDLLFSLAQLARFLKVNPEDSLRKCTYKFQRRFEFLEQEIKKQGKEFSDFSPGELEEFWEKAKSFTKTV